MNRKQKWLFSCAFVALNFCVYHNLNEWAAWKGNNIQLHVEVEGRYDFTPLLIESAAIAALFVGGFFLLKDPKKSESNLN
jgi:hypothetical protein